MPATPSGIFGSLGLCSTSNNSIFCRTSVEPGERVVHSSGLPCLLRSPASTEHIQDEGG
jgi:hypothetical protein